MSEYSQILSKLDELQDSLNNLKITAQQVALQEGLSDLSERLGLIQSGEFRAGNSKEPGGGFSGVRMGYPPFTYASEDWHLVGVLNDVLQFGLSATNGKAYFGGGVNILDQYGIHVYDAGGKPAMIALSADETINGEALGAGDVLIGDNSSSKPNMLWDKSAGKLSFRVGTNLSSYITTAGFTQIAAKVSSNGYSNTISNNSLTTYMFDNEDYDDSGFVDLATDNTKITIPSGQGGIYTVTINGVFTGNATGVRTAIAYKNGTDAFVASQIAPPGTNNCTLNFNEDISLSAGDYVILKVLQNSGGSLTAGFNMQVRKIR